MNRAKDIVYPPSDSRLPAEVPSVSADTPVVDLLAPLLESPTHVLSVSDGERSLGLLTESLLLQGLAEEFASRADCAIVTLECPATDYSASRIAMAVEDSGHHLLDLWTLPRPEGHLAVSLRVQCDDPSGVVHSLERYGFEVIAVHSRNYSDAEKARERFEALQAYLNV